MEKTIESEVLKGAAIPETPFEKQLKAARVGETLYVGSYNALELGDGTNPRSHPRGCVFRYNKTIYLNGVPLASDCGPSWDVHHATGAIIHDMGSKEISVTGMKFEVTGQYGSHRQHPRGLVLAYKDGNEMRLCLNGSEDVLWEGYLNDWAVLPSGKLAIVQGNTLLIDGRRAFRGKCGGLVQGPLGVHVRLNDRAVRIEDSYFCESSNASEESKTALRGLGYFHLKDIPMIGGSSELSESRGCSEFLRNGNEKLGELPLQNDGCFVPHARGAFYFIQMYNSNGDRKRTLAYFKVLWPESGLAPMKDVPVKFEGVSDFDPDKVVCE